VPQEDQRDYCPVMFSSLALEKYNSGYNHYYLFLIIISCLDHLISLSIKVPPSVCALKEENSIQSPNPNKEQA